MSRNSNKDLYFRFRERWNRLVNGSGNQSVLVAVSGGLDSMVCLHLFTRLRDETGLTIYAAHVNHGLRPEAKEDEALVQSVCARNGIPLDTRRIAEAPTPGESLEDWARNQRYALLELAAAGFQAQYIVTAHHANDQAETVLWRLQNGAG
ncbi:MAG: tRNA lysidine(34) synthetase TilS, partial [Candidatus Neomarinimicrobiota bacterium]